MMADDGGAPPIQNYAQQSIGSANTELSKYVLNDEEYTKSITLKLAGFYERYKVDAKNPTVILTQVVYSKDSSYPQPAIDWMERKIRSILQKGTYLSQFDRLGAQDEMLCIAVDFAEELYILSDELLTDEKKAPGQYTELCNLYFNAISFSVRRAIGESEKNFLSNTSGETTVVSRQTIEDKRKGLIDTILRR